MPVHHLRTSVPKAGFLWPSQASVLSREREDRAVIVALCDYGGCTNLRAGAAGQPRPQIEAALAAMFHEAQRIVEEDEHAVEEAQKRKIEEAEAWGAKVQTEELPRRILERSYPSDFVGELWLLAPFGKAAGVDEDIFIELFIELLKARRAWWAAPRWPFTYAEHGELARAIDEFDLAVGDDWEDDDVRDDLFAMAMAGATAQQGAGEGQEAEEEGGDSDVEMGEGEEAEDVRELRTRLAATDLGDDGGDQEMGDD